MSDQAPQNKLCRDAAGRIAGVCAGISQRLGVDAVLIRMAAVVLCVLTFGLAGVVYLVLWAMLPQQGTPLCRQVDVDVEASDISSELYGQVAATPGSSDTGHIQAPVAVALAVGVIALVAVMGILLSRMTARFEPLQFWPMAIMAAGIVRMVLPDVRGRRGWPFAAGIALLVLGAVALLHSLGIVHMQWRQWLQGCFPLLLLTLAFFGVGLRLRSASPGPWLLLVSAILAAVFVVLGFALYLQPGNVDQVVVALPGALYVPFML